MSSSDVMVAVYHQQPGSTSTSPHINWPQHQFYSKHIPTPADIGGAPSRPRSLSRHHSSQISMSSALHASTRIPSISQHLEGGEGTRKRNLSRTNSITGRTLPSWVRRRRGDEAGVASTSSAAVGRSAPESPLSSAVKSLYLPPPASSSSLPATSLPVTPLHQSPPPSVSLHASSSSSGGLSRLFSVRRKGRTNPLDGERILPSADAERRQSPPLAIIAMTDSSPSSQRPPSKEMSGKDKSMGNFTFPAKPSEEYQQNAESEEKTHMRPSSTEHTRTPLPANSSLHRSKSLSMANRLTSRFGNGSARTKITSPSRSSREQVQATSSSSTPPSSSAPFTSPPSSPPPKTSIPNRIRQFSLTRSPSKTAATTLEGTTRPLTRSSSILNALDLRHSIVSGKSNDSPAVASSSNSPATVRNSRARTLSRDGLSGFSPTSPSTTLEGRVRKLSLKGFNPFKVSQQSSSDNPKTPEIETWKREGAPAPRNITKREAQEQSGLGLGLNDLLATRKLATPQLSGSPMSSRALLRSAGIQSSMSTNRATPRPSDVTSPVDKDSSALGLISGEERSETPGPEFVSGLTAISSGWTEVSSMRSSMSKTTRPTVPSLDLLITTAGDSTNDSSFPSTTHRPYSLISTDAEGNDTPIVRLRKLIVDTKEEDDDDDEQGQQRQLFFRPVTAGGTRISPTGSSSSRYETEYLQESPAMTTSASDAGLLGTAPSVTSSGSSTINVRLISEQMQQYLRRGHGGDIANNASEVIGHERAPSIQSLILEEGSDNQMQFQQQQQQPPISSVRNSKHHSRSDSGPPRSSTSARASLEASSSGNEKRRESVFSSQTDSSVYEAVLSRATSTRLQAAPLRKMKVQEWAQKIVSTQAVSDSSEVNEESAIPDIPDEPSSSLENIPAVSRPSPQSDFTFRAPTIGHQQPIKSRQSSSNLSEAARIGRVPAKRLRRVQSPVAAEDKDKDSKPDVVKSSSSRTLRPSRSSNVLETKIKVEDLNSTENIDQQVRKSKSHSNSHKHSRSLSTKKSYLTSEEAATAKRKEQEDKERRSKERKEKKDLAKQKAYAEKKRQDPLLKMRLALAGLTSLDDTETKEEDMYDYRITNDSNTAISKASYHTAGEAEAEAEEQMEMGKNVEARYHHRRNEPSTASAATAISTQSMVSSIGTIANTANFPFPKPPQRHDLPTKAEDGTVLARARLQSHDDETPKIPTQPLPSDVYMVLEGQRVRLSRDASVRESPVKIHQPLVIQATPDTLRTEKESRHRSHVPEVSDR